MSIYIALFRGINVGGKNPHPMKVLVDILETLGSRNVETYIQSGNAVFQHGEPDALRLTLKIQAEIRTRCGFEPHVLLLRPEEFEAAFAGNPFREAVSQPKTLHVAFLASAPVKPDLKKLEILRKNSERFSLKDKVFYLHAPEGLGRSKLAAGLEKSLGVSLTSRNWRTVCSVRSMLPAVEGEKEEE